MMNAKTKLIVSVLNGGKAAGSQVKYSKFYLIVDGHADRQVNLTQAFLKFKEGLRKAFSSVKAGVSNILNSI